MGGAGYDASDGKCLLREVPASSYAALFGGEKERALLPSSRRWCGQCRRKNRPYNVLPGPRKDAPVSFSSF